MNVKQLKKAIQDLPDSAPVLLSGSDHSYNEADCVITEAASFKIPGYYRQYSEYFGDEHLEEGEAKVIVCAIT